MNLVSMLKFCSQYNSWYIRNLSKAMVFGRGWMFRPITICLITLACICYTWFNECHPPLQHTRLFCDWSNFHMRLHMLLTMSEPTRFTTWEDLSFTTFACIFLWYIVQIKITSHLNAKHRHRQIRFLNWMYCKDQPSVVALRVCKRVHNAMGVPCKKYIETCEVM